MRAQQVEEMSARLQALVSEQQQRKQRPQSGTLHAGGWQRMLPRRVLRGCAALLPLVLRAAARR